MRSGAPIASVTSTCRRRPSGCGRRFTRECACTRCERPDDRGGFKPGPLSYSLGYIFQTWNKASRLGIRIVRGCLREHGRAQFAIEREAESMIRTVIATSALAIGLVAAFAQS